MVKISIPDTLRRVCQQQGLSLPASCTADELRQLLPAIVQSLGNTQRQCVAELAKSALMVRQIGAVCPNEGIVRAERLGEGGGEWGNDPNSCLESLLPLGVE